MRERSRLDTECRYLAEEIYGVAPDVRIVDQYVRAHELESIDGGLDFVVDIDYLVSNRIAAADVEFFSRLFLGENCLTRKIKLLAYLLEISGELVVDKARDARVVGFVELAFALLSSLKQVVVGGYLIWRHKELLSECSKREGGQCH